MNRRTGKIGLLCLFTWGDSLRVAVTEAAFKMLHKKKKFKLVSIVIAFSISIAFGQVALGDIATTCYHVEELANGFFSAQFLVFERDANNVTGKLYFFQLYDTYGVIQSYDPSTGKFELFSRGKMLGNVSDLTMSHDATYPDMTEDIYATVMYGPHIYWGASASMADTIQRIDADGEAEKLCNTTDISSTATAPLSLTFEPDEDTGGGLVYSCWDGKIYKIDKDGTNGQQFYPSMVGSQPRGLTFDAPIGSTQAKLLFTSGHAPTRYTYRHSWNGSLSWDNYVVTDIDVWTNGDPQTAILTEGTEVSLLSTTSAGEILDIDPYVMNSYETLASGFSSLTGIEIDENNRIYVAATENDGTLYRLTKVCDTLEGGWQPEIFADLPEAGNYYAICIKQDSSGNPISIIVTRDFGTNNSKMDVYDIATGTWSTQNVFGGPGHIVDLKFSMVNGASSELYAAVQWGTAEGVIKINPDGTWVQIASGNYDTSSLVFNRTSVGNTDYLWYTDHINRRLRWVKSDGSAGGQAWWQPGSKPSGLLLEVKDTDGITNDKFLYSCNNPNTVGYFYYPSWSAVLTSGTSYIQDAAIMWNADGTTGSAYLAWNGKIIEISDTAASAVTFDNADMVAHGIDGLTAIATDMQGYIYALDTVSNRILRFTAP